MSRILLGLVAFITLMVFFFVSATDAVFAIAIWQAQEVKLNVLDLFKAAFLSLSTMVFFGILYYLNNQKSLVYEKCCLFFERQKPFLKPAFILFGIAFVFYFTFLDSLILIVDNEMSAVRTDQSVWIGQGRWTNYVVQLMIQQPVIPYFLHLLLCIVLVISYLFILAAHDIKINIYAYLTFPIFCAMPTLMMMNEFYANIPGNALAFLLISIDMYFFKRIFLDAIIKQEKILSIKKACYIVVLSFLAAIAIGAYQSFILLLMCMGLGVLILSAINHHMNNFQLIKSIIILLTLTLSSFLMYDIIQKIFLDLLEIKTGYIESLSNFTFSYAVLFERITKMLIATTGFYFGLSVIYASSLAAIGFLTAWGVFCILQKISLDKEKITLFIILMVLCMLLLPFSLDLVAGFNLPLRTFVSLSYVIWFFVFCAIMFAQKNFRTVAIALLVLGNAQILYNSSLHAAAREVFKVHEQLLAQSVYQKIIDIHPNFDRNKIYPIAICGEKHMASIYPTARSSNTTLSFFGANGGQASRVVNYMKLIGFNNIDVSHTDKNKLMTYFAVMPVWPVPGSVKVVENDTLIKFDANCVK